MHKYGRLNNPYVVIGKWPFNGKKILLFGVASKASSIPFYAIRFVTIHNVKLFFIPSLPKKLDPWKHRIAQQIDADARQCVQFDLKTAPKEISNIFFSTLANAVKTPGIGVALLPADYIFLPDETYEEVSIEADLMPIG